MTIKQRMGLLIMLFLRPPGHSLREGRRNMSESRGKSDRDLSANSRMELFPPLILTPRSTYGEHS